MERLIKTNRCLWYMDLRTGAIVLGHFDAVCSIFAVIKLFIVAIIIYALQDTYDVTSMKYTNHVYLIIFVLVLIVNICFLYGIFNNKPAFLVPQLVLNIVRFGFLLFAIVVSIIVVIIPPSYYVSNAFDINIAFPYLIIILLVIAAFLWHVIVVTYSLFKKIKENESSRRNNIGAVYQPNAMPQYQTNMVPLYPAANAVPQYPIKTEPQYPGLHV